MSSFKIETAADLDRLISTAIPEGQSIEYKSDLSLARQKERLEALKDLSGMGNAGGVVLEAAPGIEPGYGALQAPA